MVLPDSHEVSRASQYSGISHVLFSFEYGTITRYGVTFQLSSSAYSRITYADPTTPLKRIAMVWPIPISLAATLGVSFDFLSSGYWDVSLPRVSSIQTMNSSGGNGTLLPLGCPIQTSLDHRIFSSSPMLFAAYHVFLRLLAPRHPPVALNNLSQKNFLFLSLLNCKRTAMSYIAVGFYPIQNYEYS